ncbi:MAG: T-complex protein 1 subunit epsilon [Amphiamblys sp. WSBS2006]|nr:MAG: T-complex protein 1 subunit epsilon [Amphiamblys sp. WSBS2006]
MGSASADRTPRGISAEKTQGAMSLIYDKDGKPYMIVKEEEKKNKITGIEAQKKILSEGMTVSSSLKGSFGPKGLDKILINSDGDITLTNDGATILQNVEFSSSVSKLLVGLSKSQDDQIGDGTTGVIVFAGGLLEQIEGLLSKGIHPLKIADGFEKACGVAVQRLDEIVETIEFSESNRERLLDMAQTSLNSKVVSRNKKQFAQIAVDAVFRVADRERRDLNMELIKVIGHPGGEVGDTRLFDGVLLEKPFSHPQMPSEITDAKIAILTCPFEPPKPKTKHKLTISDVSEFAKLQEYEKNAFRGMISKLKEEGVTVAACQWGFDDEANHLLVSSGLSAIRWIGGMEIEQLAIATDGRIVPRFEDITGKKLGRAGRIKEIHCGTGKEKMLLVEECAGGHTVSVLVRGGNKMVVEEAKRSLHDSICAVRNILRDGRVVCGGGSCEIACSVAVESEAEKSSGEEEYVLRAFARGLESVPLVLANNSGLDGMQVLSSVRAKHVAGKGSTFGVDCMGLGESDMKAQKVFEGYLSKREQIILATQMVKMLLKIDEVIERKAE